MPHAEALLRELRALKDAGDKMLCVHYSCQSWFAVKDRPVGVSCISIVDVNTNAETTFSLVDRKDGPEQYVLEGFFEFLRENSDARLIHWNMNRSDYGFQALSNRLAFITQKPPPAAFPADRLVDLEGIISGLFGKDFAEHPKLVSLAKLNQYRTKYWLAGAEEAAKFEKGEHGDIRRSSTEKTQALAYLTKRLIAGSLETKTSGLHLRFDGTTLNSVEVIQELGRKFLDVSRQLKKRHSNRATLEVNDEYDAQDLFHSLLRIFFSDVRPEQWAPQYAGGATRIDFVIPTHRIAIELKHSRAGLDAKKVGEELIIDTAKYKTHPGVRHLVCLVFDYAGNVDNPRGLEADLSGPREGLLVSVQVIDR